MRSTAIGMTTLVIICWTAGCGGGTAIVGSTPLPGPAAGVATLASPQGRMDVSIPEAEWTPVMIGSARGESFIRALQEVPTLALILPKRRSSVQLEDRVFQMVAAAAPETKIVARGTATLDELLEEQGEIPYRTTMEYSGTDERGEPVYVPKEHPLNTEWLDRREPLKGAQAMLVVRPIDVRDLQLKELRSVRQGGCDDFIASLRGSLVKAQRYFESYEEEASAILAKAHTRQLEAAMPFWKREISAIAAEAAPGSTASRCAGVYLDLIGKYAPCVDGPCDTRPEVFATAGGVIGMTDPSLIIPKQCPAPGMRDYAAEARALAERAVHEVLPSLDEGWAGELVRYGGLAALLEAVEEGCAPRHRRIRADALVETRDAVSQYLSELGDKSYAASWMEAKGQERVPGIGAIRVLARVRATAENPMKKAGDIAKRIRALDQCDEGREQPIQVTLVDVGSSEVRFMGIFFEEELLCNGLPPR